LDRADSLRLKRLSSLAKQLDASTKKTAKTRESASQKLQKARRAALIERRMIQMNSRAKKEK
jgi:hypothetical protein